jgi:hypothetical protein
MPTRTTARPAPTTSDLRDFLAGLGPDTDAAILRAVATVDALRAPYATASRRAHVRRVARELVVLAVRGESTDPLDLGAARSDADALPRDGGWLCCSTSKGPDGTHAPNRTWADRQLRRLGYLLPEDQVST